MLEVENISMIFYGVFILIFLIILFIKCPTKRRKSLASFVSLISLIIFISLVNYPLISFLLFFLVILNLLYIILIHLPYFTEKSDRDIFFEAHNEIWNDLKINNSIIPEE